MKESFATALSALSQQGNLRRISEENAPEGLLDLSSNDYLGLGQDQAFRRYLLEYALEHELPVSASASRLLAAHQEEFTRLERLIGTLYPGRKALTFNSGYHANTGIISALADRSTLVLADRLVHASIIDGIVLSRAQMMRFRHNDYAHLRELLDTKGKDFSSVLIVAESVYSMDGDKTDIDELARIKQTHPGALLYIDEAHAFGVEGPQGRGCSVASSYYEDVDVIVGTFGKAIATAGAFAAVAPEVREYLVNRARSLIFSTALPPAVAAWSRLSIEKMLGMDAERAHLCQLGQELSALLGNSLGSHIQPYIVGDAQRAVELSQQLLSQGIKVLPIRTPTVPPGTERLRFSLSAAIPELPKFAIHNS
ncbi:MAG: 8-amino-7-oxononanoate synthase [Bacteroidales bacterium]|nr:8-amino-7-oxononanoate synthase [Bacteroidales bacterium]